MAFGRLFLLPVKAECAAARNLHATGLVRSRALIAASYAVPPIYAAFVWWFSTGAVLLLVGRAGRFEVLLRVYGGLHFWWRDRSAVSRSAPADTSVEGAYTAFTCTILLWGAQEIAFLSGWVTGPRPERCPARLRDGEASRSWHCWRSYITSSTLLACGAADCRVDVRGIANQVAVWTFAALWVLQAKRQDQPVSRRARYQ